MSAIDWSPNFHPIAIGVVGQVMPSGAGAAALVVLLATLAPASAAETASMRDKAFVAKISRNGAFEAELGKAAGEQGSTQAIRDNGAVEAHDHALRGARLAAICATLGVAIDSEPSTYFQSKLFRIKALRGKDFDAAYIEEMEKVHKIDDGLLAQEAIEGGANSLKAYVTETRDLVAEHLGELRAGEHR